MKNSSKQGPKVEEDELRPEYRFDYSKARPNRFLEGLTPGGIAVFLEPDVAKVFNSSETVNRFLRSVIQAVREKSPGTAAKKRKAS